MISVAALCLRLFSRYAARFAAFAVCVLLIGVSCAFIGQSALTMTGEPSVIAVIDLDNSMESRLVMNNLVSGQIAETTLVRLELLTAGDGEDAAALAEKSFGEDGAAAVIVIPKDYARDVMNGKNPPFSIILNPRKPLAALVITAYAGAFTDMLKAAQSGVYAALDYAASQNDEEKYNQTFMRVNMKFISTVLGRGNIYEKTEIPPVGEGLAVHYYKAACIFVLSLAAPLFAGLVRGAAVKNALRLRSLGVLEYETVLGVFLAVFAVYAPLFALCDLGGVFAGFSGSDLARHFGWLASCAAVSAFAAFCSVFFRGGAAVSAGVFVISALALFVSGGVIPSVMLPAAAREIGALVNNKAVYTIFWLLLAYAALVFKTKKIYNGGLV